MVVVRVESDRVRYTPDYIEADYDYHTTDVHQQADEPHVLRCVPRTTEFVLRTARSVPKTCLALVGWGGNNGSTVTAMLLANRAGLTWRTRDGVQRASYLGSITQASTVALGSSAADGREIYAPMRDLLPLLDPNELAIDGWDISGADLAASMERACVLDADLQRQLYEQMKVMRPRRAIYDADFIAANQASRADNVLTGLTRRQAVDAIRRDLREMRSRCPNVVVVWTANTERFSRVTAGVHDTADALLSAIERDDAELSPSTLYATAAVLEGVAYVNGSPQNTFVPGLVELACRRGVAIAGDDFKSGQTKLKSVLVDFLVGAGIRPLSIVSYNHLGNNDGRNLSAPAQFRSKEASKSGVIDDMVASNPLLFPSPADAPDHCVVIRYVPAVGDSKRAMDEYTSELAMAGRNTIVVHNTCEDSLLAAPIIVDLVVLTEFCQRVQLRFRQRHHDDIAPPVRGQQHTSQQLRQPHHRDPLEFARFDSVLSVLSYLCKAPLVPAGTPVVNALFRQRSCIENVLRACIGLAPVDHMLLERSLNADMRAEFRRRARRLGRCTAAAAADDAACSRPPQPTSPSASPSRKLQRPSSSSDAIPAPQLATPRRGIRCSSAGSESPSTRTPQPAGPSTADVGTVNAAASAAAASGDVGSGGGGGVCKPGVISANTSDLVRPLLADSARTA